MEPLFVIKIGGNVIDNDHALVAFLEGLSSLQSSWILVHGGGKLATDLSARLGIATQMIDGRRITDKATLDVVTMVYGGLVNKRIVVGLQALGINALGITGADGNIIRAKKREHPTTDYGFVGDIVSVHAERLQSLLQSSFLLVLAPLTHDGAGSILNTNADTIAAEVAAALARQYDVRLVYCFEKPGVLQNVNDDNSVIPHVTYRSYEELRTSDIIVKGMIPKMDNAFAALRRGVSSVVIASADSVRLLGSNTAFGTTIVLE